MPKLEAPPIKKRPKQKRIIAQQPPYHVILHNDEFHSYDYVVKMLIVLFRKNEQDAVEDAEEVDKFGTAIVDTTTLERAELKRDQILAFGPDKSVEGSRSSMVATIEAAQ